VPGGVTARRGGGLRGRSGASPWQGVPRGPYLPCRLVTHSRQGTVVVPNWGSGCTMLSIWGTCWAWGEMGRPAAALVAKAAKTGCTSVGERLITRRISLVAVCVARRPRRPGTETG
jgi:hypothetical protein